MEFRLARGIFFGGLLLFLAVALLQTLLRLFDVLVVLFLGLILSQAIEPAIASMERRRVPRPAGVLAIYLTVLMVAVSIGWLAIPPVVDDVGGLVAKLPEFGTAIVSSLTPLNAVLLRFGIEQEYGASLAELLRQLGGSLLSVLTLPFALLHLLVSFFTVFVFAFLFSVSGGRLFVFLLSFVHPQQRQAVEVVAQHVGARLGGYVRSELLVMASVGLLCWFGLLIIGVPFPHLFALVAFFTEAIPMVGPVLGAIPPVVVALFISPWLALQVVVIYTLVQQIENYLLVPIIHGNQLTISPLLVLTALLIGGSLFGIVGAFIAVPVAATLQVLVEDAVVPWRQAQIKRDLHGSAREHPRASTPRNEAEGANGREGEEPS